MILSMDGDPQGNTKRSMLRKRIMERLGISMTNKKKDDLMRTQWSKEFHENVETAFLLLFRGEVSTQKRFEFYTLCRNRLIMGAIRYGCVHENDNTLNRPQSIYNRLAKCIVDRNKEPLVDIFNEAMLEYVDPRFAIDLRCDKTKLVKEIERLRSVGARIRRFEEMLFETSNYVCFRHKSRLVELAVLALIEFNHPSLPGMNFIPEESNLHTEA